MKKTSNKIDVGTEIKVGASLVAVEQVGDGYNLDGKLVPYVWFTDPATERYLSIEMSKCVKP